MKKVLALVLAVVMVCTMAMAIGVAVTPATVVTSSTGLGTVTLSDPTANYVLKLDASLFTPVLKGLNADQVSKDTMKVEGVSGSFNGVDYIIPIKNEDKALDGKADYSISTLKITNLKSNDTYVVYNAKDGKLVMSEWVLGGVPQKATEVDFYAAYDIGYATNTTVGTLAEGWNFFKDNAVTKANLNVAGTAAATATLTVDKGVAFKLARKIVDSSVVLAKNTGMTSANIVDNIEGVKTTAGVISYKVVTRDKDCYFYVADKDGNLYKAPFTFTAEKQADGTYVATWTYTGTGFDGSIYVTNKAFTAADLPGTATNPGTTTNPGTGANDVVGVAAALAVVALVSGAAISLKK